MSHNFLYVVLATWPQGSMLKYYTLLQRAFGGDRVEVTSSAQLLEAMKAKRYDLVFVHGDHLDFYKAPLAASVPYVLVEHDVYSMRATLDGPGGPNPVDAAIVKREEEMIANAVAMLFTSQGHVRYLRKRYELPPYTVVHLRPLRSQIDFEPKKEKLPGKHLVYVGGIVPEDRRMYMYGYRSYHGIFRAFMEAGWTVHVYPAFGTSPVGPDYARIGVVVHDQIPYDNLLREMGQYTAGLQAFNREGVPKRAFAYTQQCIPNKTYDHLAAGIPTIGVNPGMASRIYTKGGWGVVLSEVTPEAIKRLDSNLPVITESMRQAQVMEKDLPKLRRLIACALDRIDRRRRQLTRYKPITPKEGYMLLRVKPVLSIPRTVKIAYQTEVTFNPDTEVPDKIADRILANDPQHYEKAVGEPDLTKYLGPDGKPVQVKEEAKAPPKEEKVSPPSEAKKAPPKKATKGKVEVHAAAA